VFVVFLVFVVAIEVFAAAEQQKGRPHHALLDDLARD